MHTIHLPSGPYTIPSKWDELSARQMKRMSWLSRLEGSPVDIAKILFLILTLSLPFWKRMRLQFFYFFQANTVERADLLFCTRSFDEYRQITTQKIKKIRCTFVLLYGPDSGLSNCTFWEYVKAEQYFLNYLEKKDPIWLDKLIATLYRPAAKGFDPMIHDDRRIPLNDTAVRFRLKVVSRINEDTKLAILMWFDGCRSQLIRHFPLVFKKTDPTKPTTAKNSVQSSSKGWMNLISELAGSMDNYDKIGKTNLYTAMTDISHRIHKRNEEIKRQLTASRRKR